MDRRIVYQNQLPEDTDILLSNKNAYIGLAKLASAILGTTPLLNNFACTPTSPAGLTVNVAPGEIYSLQFVDPSNYGSVAFDTTNQIVKQGILLTTTNCSCPAPTTPGQSINYLIEIAFNETDTSFLVLPYYNASNIDVPYNGPNNSGTSQATIRQDGVTITVKAGIPAQTGTQTTPSPDSNYIGAWVVTVNYGDTQILSTAISQYLSTNFITETLTQKVSIPTGDERWAKIGSIQSGSYRYGTDTGTVNAIVTTLSPSISSYSAGLIFTVKILNTNTGSTTINANSVGVANIHNLSGGTLNPGDLVAGMLAELQYDGTNFQLLNTANIVTLSTVQKGSYLYSADSGLANAYIATLNPSPTAYTTGMIIELNVLHTNTSSTCTVNANSLGIKNIKLTNGSALNIGDLVVGMIAHLVYDGTEFQLLNPATWASQYIVQNGSVNFAIDSGTANNYSIVLSPTLPGYITGMRIFVKIKNTNTGASTINVNGLGNVNIITMNGSSLPSGALIANHFHQFIYDGTKFVLLTSERVLAPNNNAFYAYQGTAQTITTSPTIVTINTKQFDNGNNYNTTSFGFVAPLAGDYIFTGAVSSNGSGGTFGWSFYLNGATVYGGSSASAGSSMTPSSATIVSMAVGDGISILANSSGSITTDPGIGHTWLCGYGPI